MKLMSPPNLAGRKKLESPHPGDVLRDEFMTPLALASEELSQRTGIPKSVLADLMAGRGAVTPHVAERLGRFFETHPDMWRGLQVVWEEEAMKRMPLESIVPLSEDEQDRRKAWVARSLRGVDDVSTAR